MPPDFRLRLSTQMAKTMASIMVGLAAVFVADGSVFYGIDLGYRVAFAVVAIGSSLLAIHSLKLGASISVVTGLYGTFLSLASMAPGEIQEVGAISSLPPPDEDRLLFCFALIAIYTLCAALSLVSKKASRHE